MRAALLVLLSLTACRRGHREPPDAGPPKPLLLKLSRPAIETEGERWVPRSATRGTATTTPLPAPGC